VKLDTREVQRPRYDVRELRPHIAALASDMSLLVDLVARPAVRLPEVA
jgi:hypothetical protein